METVTVDHHSSHAPVVQSIDTFDLIAHILQELVHYLLYSVQANQSGEFIVEVEGDCHQSCRDAIVTNAQNAVSGNCFIDSPATKLGRLSFLKLTCDVSLLVSARQASEEIHISSSDTPVLRVAVNRRVYKSSSINRWSEKKDGRTMELSPNARFSQFNRWQGRFNDKMTEIVPQNVQKRVNSVFPQLFPSSSPSSSASPSQSSTPSATPSQTSSPTPSSSKSAIPSTSSTPTPSPSSSKSPSPTPRASNSPNPTIITLIDAPEDMPEDSVPSPSHSPEKSQEVSTSPSVSASNTVSQDEDVDKLEQENDSSIVSSSISPSKSAPSPSTSTSSSVSASKPAPSPSPSVSPSSSSSNSVPSPSSTSFELLSSASVSPSLIPSASSSPTSSALPSVSASASPSTVSVATSQSDPVSWNIDEVDGIRDNQRTCSTSNNGQGANVFIVDTGCRPQNGGSCSGSQSYNNFDCADDDGHGTHIAGIVQDEIYGVANNARISCFKSLDYMGAGWDFDVIQGIAFAVENGADVINLSLGGYFDEVAVVADAVEEAAKSNRIYFTISAGNSYEDACSIDPARASGANIYTVQAHNENGRIAWFSNQGSCTDLSAPGVDILSNTIGETAIWPNQKNPDTFSGTSMAAPHVAGTIARMLSDGQRINLQTLTGSGMEMRDNSGSTIKSLGSSCSG